MAAEIPVNRSKIVVPALRPEVLRRVRLLGFLDQLLEKKLLLITAPAGYGKTTLLIDMAHAAEMPVCWLALDDLDRDPQRFLSYLIAALARRFPRFGRQSATALRRLVSFEQDSEPLLSTLVNEVYDQIDEHFVLIIDDFQFVDTVREIAGFVSRFVHLCADHCHVILSSRRLPALPDIALLVARQQVLGFDLDELSFRPDEVRLLFEKNYAVRLDDSMVEQLVRRTEGWITGLHLSAPAVSGGLPDLNRAARAAGVDLAGYFDGQVLALQPPVLRSFLLRTSIIEEFDAGLCAAVFGKGNWKQRIEEVKRGNLFVQPVGPRGNAIRYHPLFQNFLQERFRSESPAQAVQVLQRLARAYEERGDWEKAYQACRQQADVETLAGLVERAGTPMLVNERLLTLQGWLNGLPAVLLQTRPGLLSLQGALLCALGRGTQALALLDEAVRGFRTAADLPGLALAIVRRAAALRLLGNYASAMQDAEEALALSRHAPGLEPVYAEAARFKGLSLFRLGQPGLAIHSLQESLDCYLRLDEPASCARLQMELGIAFRTTGDASAARQAYELALAEWQRQNNLHSQANVWNNLGVLHHLRGEYEAAVRAIEKGLDCARAGGSAWQEALLLTSLGDIYLELDEFIAASQAFETALGIASQADYQFLVRYLNLAQAQLQRLLGHLADAHLRLDAIRQSVESSQSNYERGLYYLEMGCLSLADEASEPALAAFDQALECFRHGSLALETLWATVWLAAAFACAGDLPAARQRLGEAIRHDQVVHSPHALVRVLRRARPWLSDLTADAQAGPWVASWLEKALQIEAGFPALRRRLRRLFTTVPMQAPCLTIHALGKAQVRVNGRVVTTSQWQTASVRDLFFYFVSRSRPVTKEEVGEAFWPELNAASLKLRFKNDLYRLRRALGSDVILFEDDLYRFNRSLDYEYDVEAFDSFVGRAGADADEEPRLACLEQAAALWHGPYLQNVDAIWAWPERQRLSQAFLNLLRDLAGLHRARGRDEQALKSCQRALEMDPCLEEFHRLAMELHAARGDRVAVIRQYQSCRAALQSELGVDPSPATEALLGRLAG